LLYSVYALLLSRLSQSDDLVIGVPSAGQASSGQTHLLGHCVNMLPVRNQIASCNTFDDLLHYCKARLYAAHAHRQISYSELLPLLALSRDPSRMPLVTTVFNVDQEPHTLEFAQTNARFDILPRAFENFELYFTIVVHDESLELQCQYNSDLFQQESVELWIENYLHLLNCCLQQPDQLLHELPISPLQARLITASNATERMAFKDCHTLPLIQSCISEFNAMPAAVFADNELSYGELDAASRKLAAVMQEKGVKPGDRVGLGLNRGLHLSAAMMAVWRCGACYIPMDPAYPLGRLQQMLDDAGAVLLLVDEQSGVDLKPLATPMMDLQKALQTSECNLKTVPMDPDALAYIIFTSGSTGRPKGVEISHRALANFLQSMRENPGMQVGDRLLGVTTVSFDIAALELLLPLCVGATSVIAAADEVSDGQALLQLIQKQNINCMQATPVSWRLLLASGWQGDDKFRAFCGGEAMPSDLQQQLSACCGELWNLYGPTETCIWSSCKKVSLSDNAANVGKPIANTRFHVVGEHGRELPVGIAGELHIAGSGLAHAYCGQPDLTDERFIAAPYLKGERVYRTGDLVRWTTRGEIECLGRLDRQVKLRGYRIELGEIEAVLSQAPELQAVVVDIHELGPGDVRLVAWGVCTPGSEFSIMACRKLVRSSLPDYMVPQHFVALDEFPLTANGKIDRKRLPPVQSQAKPARQVPETAGERLIAEIWQELLNIEVDDSLRGFFDYGGYSLLAVEFVRRFEGQTGKRVVMRDLALLTLAQIAAKYACDTPVSTSVETPIEKKSTAGSNTLRRVLRRILG
jgi:amino acid adenylation domain-containing protein